MNKGNLLIIEDEEPLINLLSELMSVHADNIYLARNGQEGLQQVEEHDVHAIVCDINMPVMDGITFISKIRDKNYQHPVIFYTAHGDEVHMRKALSYGAFDFLTKPNFENLEQTVIKALNEGKGLFDKESLSSAEDPVDEIKDLISKE